MNKTNNGLLDENVWARAPKPVGSIWERIGKAFYDPEERSILGRTPKRWGIAITFYSIFYIVLALMFGICMGVMQLTLKTDRPKWTLDSSLIGANPGLTLRPRAEDFSPSIRITADNDTYGFYINQLKQFLAPYENSSRMAKYDKCVAADNYGYPHSPCIYLKLNKIYGWVPECYDDVGSMSDELKKHVEKHVNNLNKDMRKQVWITCEADPNSTIISYPWGRGLPAEDLAYTNQMSYLSPLLAVQVKPTVNGDTTVRCHAWAKNIIYRRSIKDPSGYAWVYIHFESSTKPDVTTSGSVETTAVTESNI